MAEYVSRDSSYSIISAGSVIELHRKVQDFLDDTNMMVKRGIRVEGGIFVDREYSRSGASMTPVYCQVVVVYNMDDISQTAFQSW